MTIWRQRACQKRFSSFLCRGTCVSGLISSPVFCRRWRFIFCIFCLHFHGCSARLLCIPPHGKKKVSHPWLSGSLGERGAFPMLLMCWMETKETSYRCLDSLSSFFLISITGNFTCEHLKKLVWAQDVSPQLWRVNFKQDRKAHNIRLREKCFASDNFLIILIFRGWMWWRRRFCSRSCKSAITGGWQKHIRLTV